MEYKKITLFCLLMIGIFTSTSCKDEGKVSKLSVELGPRACKVLKLTK